MESPEAQTRAEHILKELGRYPSGLLTVDEVLFLATRCRRLAGAQTLVVGAFDESDLQELEKIAGRVKLASRKGLQRSSHSKRRPGNKNRPLT